MSTNFRIATFNCENLFERSKIFGPGGKQTTDLLAKVSDLQEELSKKQFDHSWTKALKDELRYYVKINDIRGKHNRVIGSKDWLGWGELKREPANSKAIKNTVRVISDVNADILCLVEVENRLTLQRFHDQLLSDRLRKEGKDTYKNILLIDGNDNRGIDVALMSRHPILWIKTHIDERTNYGGKNVHLFSRDCLEVAVKVAEHTIILLINHFKSMGYSPNWDKRSEVRRRLQAERVAEIVATYGVDQENFVVAGDLNTWPSALSLRSLLRDSGLYNVNEELPAGQRGTHGWTKKQLDYLLVSKPLKNVLKGVEIWRKGIFGRNKPHYETISKKSEQASDYACVFVDFELP
jgi:predicted extracellular nuclease